MKIGVLADIHSKEKPPEKRIEKKFNKEVIRKKLKYVMNKLKENNVGSLMIAGDLFDTVNVPHALIANIGRTLMTCGIEVFVVPGQHDMRYHATGIKNTPLGILRSFNIVNIPTLEEPITIGKDLQVYGCGFGSEVDLKALVKKVDVRESVLIVHKMITKSKALFHAQIDWISGKKFLEKYPFKIVLSGDNHERFVVENPDQVLINNGSLVRLTKAQLEYEPGFHIVDTDTLEVKFFKIPITPYAKAFDMDMINSEEEEDERRSTLLATWKNEIRSLESFSSVSFKRTLNSVSQKMQADDLTLLQIENFMEKVGASK